MRGTIGRVRFGFVGILDNGRVANVFRVRPIPTCIIIDHVGVVRGVKRATGPVRTAGSPGETRKCLKSLRKTGSQAPEGGR